MQPKQAVAFLSAAFRTQNPDETTVAIYLECLKDIPPAVLEATVRRLIDTSKFFPSIAEIRETAARLAGMLPASAPEALAIIRRADVAEPVYDRAGKLCYTEHYWRWPEDLDDTTRAAVQATLSKVGDPVDMESNKKHFGWEQGFKETYEAVEREATKLALADLSLAALPGPDRKALVP